MFPPEGEIALMFLKSYTGLSDDGLIEMLNGSVYMQLFFGIHMANAALIAARELAMKQSKKKEPA